MNHGLLFFGGITHFRFLLIKGTLSTMSIAPVGFPFLSRNVISPSIFGSLISFHICFCVFIVFFL